MVHYGLNKTKLAFDAQYNTGILNLLTYLLALALASKMLASNPSLILTAIFMLLIFNFHSITFFYSGTLVTDWVHCFALCVYRSVSI